VVHPDLVAADDAIRAASIHLLAGTGFAIELFLASGLLFDVAALTGGAVEAVSLMAALAALVGSLFAWRYYGHRAWRVQHRPIALTAPAT
jgi:hypothetical protein